MTIQISEEQVRKIRGVNLRGVQIGGFQGLFKELQLAIKFRENGPVLEVAPKTARRILSYTADSYGGGTYQSILRAMRDDVERELGKLPPPPSTGNLFGDEGDGDA